MSLTKAQAYLFRKAVHEAESIKDLRRIMIRLINALERNGWDCNKEQK